MGMTTRRGFLQATAAAVVAPYIWTGRQSPAQESANDKLGIGAIGTGGRGSGIGREACGRGNPIAVADVDSKHAERFASAFKGMKVYQDYQELLKHDDIDVVTIGTPDHWHAKIAIEALRAGKHVYCEKPLTLTIDEGKKICQAVRETGKVFQVGTQQRSDNRFRLAVAIARSGALGKPLKATCSIGAGPGGGPWEPTVPPENLNWDFWLGQCPDVPYTPQRCHGNFRWWLEYSGGKLTDWGAHHVDIAHWGLGKEHTGPSVIEGQGTFPNLPEDFDLVAFFAGKQTIPNGYNTAQQFHIDLTFDDGDQIHVQHGPDNGILFEGPNGRIFVNRQRITGTPVESLAGEEKHRMEQAALDLLKGKRARGHMQNFFDCIREGGEPVSDVFSHHRELSSCHLCTIAMLLKRKLRWDPVKEQFVDDDQANALLSRPQREAYAINV
ncbi:MAG: Gfo/Idh/MocA family oxidoreductase [Planctomycetes bacterium]|nr:Gfo/Idh/MocA family oxidoreductase [Planctomycetota bacterium]